MGQRVNWCLTYECCLGNSKGVNSCENSYLELFFQDMSVGSFRQWIERKGKIRKRHVCFGPGKRFLSEERNSDKIQKTTTTKKKNSGSTVQFLHTRLQCLSESDLLTWRNIGRDSWLEGANGRCGKGRSWIVIAHRIVSHLFSFRYISFKPQDDFQGLYLSLFTFKATQLSWKLFKVVNVASSSQMPRTSSQVYLSAFFFFFFQIKRSVLINSNSNSESNTSFNFFDFYLFGLFYTW